VVPGGRRPLLQFLWQGTLVGLLARLRSRLRGEKRQQASAFQGFPVSSWDDAGSFPVFPGDLVVVEAGDRADNVVSELRQEDLLRLARAEPDALDPIAVDDRPDIYGDGDVAELILDGLELLDSFGYFHWVFCGNCHLASLHFVTVVIISSMQDNASKNSTLAIQSWTVLQYKAITLQVVRLTQVCTNDQYK
jgi:hypothetical protein